MFGLKRSGLTVELHGPALRKDMMLFGEMRKKMWRGILMPRSLYNRGLCKTNMLYNRLDFYDKAKARG